MCMLNKWHFEMESFSLADKAKVDYQLFIIGYLLMFISLFLTTTMLGSTLPHMLISIPKYAGFVLILVDIVVYKHFDAKKLLLFLIIGVLITVNYRITHNTNLFFAMAIMIGAYGIDYKKIVLPYIVTSLVLLTIVIALSLIGIIPNIEYVRGDAVRMALGIIYPTDLGARLFYLAVAFFVYRWEKMTFKDVFLYLIIAALTWKITYARMDTFLIMSLSLGAIIVIVGNKFAQRKPWQRLSSLLCSINVVVPVLAFTLINFISYHFNNAIPIYAKLDAILSGRLSLGHTAYQYYPIKLWGQGIVQQGWGGVSAQKASEINYFMIDSAFVRLVLVYGIVLTMVILISWTFLMVDLKKKRLLALSIVLVVIAASGIIDQHMFEIAYNPILIFFSFGLVNQPGDPKKESVL